MSTAQTERRLGPLETRQLLNIEVDGESVSAFAGETVATVLLALGRRTFRQTGHGAPRGLFCGMGVCFDCLVTVDGVENVRACMTSVAEGMIVTTTSPAGARGERSATACCEPGATGGGQSHD